MYAHRHDKKFEETSSCGNGQVVRRAIIPDPHLIETIKSVGTRKNLSSCSSAQDGINAGEGILIAVGVPIDMTKVNNGPMCCGSDIPEWEIYVDSDSILSPRCETR